MTQTNSNASVVAAGKNAVPPSVSGRIGFLDRIVKDILWAQALQSMWSGFSMMLGLVLLIWAINAAGSVAEAKQVGETLQVSPAVTRAELEPARVISAVIAALLAIFAGFPLRDRARRIERVRVYFAIKGMLMWIRGSTNASAHEFVQDRFVKCVDELSKP